MESQNSVDRQTSTAKLIVALGPYFKSALAYSRDKSSLADELYSFRLFVFQF
jgi:hypothetical protein